MIFILFTVFFVFLSFFLLFIFSKQDFVLLRQNISLSEIFDAAIIVFLASLLIGRVFYILDSFNFTLLHAVKFFYLTKFPGISVLGFFLGAALTMYLLFKSKKGLRRIYDIFTISFYPLFAFFVFNQAYKNIYYFVGSLIVIIISFIFFVRSHRKYILKDGSVSLLILILVCIDVILSQFIILKHSIFFNLSMSQIVSIIIIPVSLFGIYITQKSSKT